MLQADGIVDELLREARHDGHGRRPEPDGRPAGPQLQRRAAGRHRAGEKFKMGGDYIGPLNTSRGGEQTHACMPGCVIQCSNVYHDANGKEVVSPVEYETLGLLGSNCGLTEPDDLAQLNYVANDLGVDTIETGAHAGRAHGGRARPVRRRQVHGRLPGRDRRGNETGPAAGRRARRGSASTTSVARMPVIKKQAISAYDPRVVEATGISMMATAQGADHTAGNLPRLKTREMDFETLMNQSLLQQTRVAANDSLGLCIFGQSVTEPNTEFLANAHQRRARHEPHHGLLRGARAETRCGWSRSSTGGPASRSRTTSCRRSSTRSRCRRRTTSRASTGRTCTASTSASRPEPAETGPGGPPASPEGVGRAPGHRGGDVSPRRRGVSIHDRSGDPVRPRRIGRHASAIQSRVVGRKDELHPVTVVFAHPGLLQRAGQDRVPHRLVPVRPAPVVANCWFAEGHARSYGPVGDSTCTTPSWSARDAPARPPRCSWPGRATRSCSSTGPSSPRDPPRPPDPSPRPPAPPRWGLLDRIVATNCPPVNHEDGLRRFPLTRRDRSSTALRRLRAAPRGAR